MQQAKAGTSDTGQTLPYVSGVTQKEAIELARQAMEAAGVRRL